MSLSIGQTLQGKYVVKKQLGKGGFGLTYLAEHQYLSQNCVLKVPNQELQRDPEYAKFVQKFMQEGQKLAKLAQQRHPHIVRVMDLFEERGLPCLAMDFIAGESLLDRVNRKGALPEVEVVGFILQMADALAVVHREGLVHRDCHPGNIMILPPERHQPQRQAILIDFGIAGEMFPTTVSSKFFGNPAFAPYEQFGTKAAPSMDVYTLGASCYFAVTGYLPTTGLDRKLYGKNLIPPIKHRSDLTPAFNQAIMNGMELEAINRPSLAVWTEQLQQAVAPPSVTATVRVVRPEPQGNWFENLLGLNKPNPVPHKSAKGIDYSELEKLLKNKQWYEADQLTDELMLKASGCEEKGWIEIDLESI
jgi:serine/threonine-protein kinase